MQDLTKRLEQLETDFLNVYQKLKIAEKLKKIAELEKQVADPDIWKNIEQATFKNQELAKLEDEVQPWELLKTQIVDIKELINVSDSTLKAEIEGQLEAMEDKLIELKKVLRFRGLRTIKMPLLELLLVPAEPKRWIGQVCWNGCI